MPRHLFAMPAISACLLVASPIAAQVPPASDAPPAIYPRVSVATWYQVDPSWPRIPEGLAVGHVPGIAVGPDGNVYVAVRANPPIRVFRPDGTFVRSFGTGDLNMIHHLKFDPEGNLWAADVGDHTLKRFDADGSITEILGTRGEKGLDDEHFNMPSDIAVSDSGDRFVADGYGNGRVVHIDKEGHFVKAWGEIGVAPGQFSAAHAIAMDSEGRLYVADRNNARVQIFDQEGTLLDSWDNVVIPWGLWVTPEDEIWVCGSSPMPWRLSDSMLGCPPKDQVFLKFATNGRLLQQWTVPVGQTGAEAPGECNWVHCIAADAEGNLYVGDIHGMRAQKFVPMTGGELSGELAARPEE